MDKLKLYGFNNLTKTLSFNIYDVCYADTEDDKQGYIDYIDERYNSLRLTEILKNVTHMIGAHVLNISKQDYEPQGASVTIMITEEAVPVYAVDPSCNLGDIIITPRHVVGHLDKSHITVHTYPESHPDKGITTFRLDIDVSTCGEISPLNALNYLIEAFDADIIFCDYRVRGFTRDMDGMKHYMDHQIDSIQDFISEVHKDRYKGINSNLCQENVYHTKLMIKERPLDDYLFALDEADLSKEEQGRIWCKLHHEMHEIYYGRNFEKSLKHSILEQSKCFTEAHTVNTNFNIKVEEHLHHEESAFQTIDFYKSKDFGVFFALDGYMMVNQKDEFIYHDMIVHVPMAVNPSIKKVLVIGGGDGGSVRELTRYNSIEQIDLVEIDERVVRLCQQYLPQTASALSDARVNLYFEDGVAFIEKIKNTYDLILVDSTDPIGPGEGLFTSAFYQDCYAALKPEGVLINQHESPYYEKDALEMQKAHKKLKATFDICEVYQFHMPTYPSGHWLFGFASKGLHPIKDVQDESWLKNGLATRYYNLDIHRGAFALPTYVRELLTTI